MLRIYCLQQWHDLSDPGAEETLYDIQSMRAFCNLELGRDPEGFRSEGRRAGSGSRKARGQAPSCGRSGR
jgi:IS5 family transposase